VTKKIKVIRTKFLTVEEDWYRMYHLDIEEIPNELDSSEELAEELLGWSSRKSINDPNISRSQTSNVWKTRTVRKKSYREAVISGEVDTFPE
jgi:hypothetical protein